MFDHAIMLAGLGGAVIPLVLHLLGRARYRSVEWGAMMFLDEQLAGPRVRLAAHVKEWLLLAMRMGMVALLAIALARPVVTAPDIAGEGRVTAAIVLDRSASMGIEDNGIPRIEAARQTVVRILAGLNRGDQVGLITPGDPPPSSPSAAAARRAEMRPTADLQSIATRVSDVKPSNHPADMAEALTSAWNVLEKYPRTQRRLYVVCDRQASSWRRADEPFAADWREQTAAAGLGGGGAVVVPVGGEGSDNVAVESVALVDPPAVRNTPGDVVITVRNYGRDARDAVPLTVRSGGREVYTATMRLPARGTGSARFTMSFASASGGVQGVVAQVRGPGLTSDDRYEAMLNVVEPIRTLIVSGGGGGAAFTAAALAPYHALGGEGVEGVASDLADLEVTSPRNFEEQSLASRYSLVVLDDVAGELSEAQAKGLEQFVYSGGGLLIAVGPRTSSESFNRLIYRSGGGFSPAGLGAAAPLDARGAALTPDRAHPIFAAVDTAADALPPASIARSYRVASRTSASHVIAGFASGDPLLIESAYGQGRVLLMTTPLGTEWGALPLTKFYLPFVQSAARYLVAGGIAEHTLVAGQELVATFSAAQSAAAANEARRATVQRPDGSRIAVEPFAVAGRLEVRYAQTDLPGQYVVRLAVAGAADQAQTFVVHAPPEESDITPLTPQRWQWLQDSLHLRRMEPNDPQLSPSRRGEGRTPDLWLAALAGVLALLVAELGLARWWSSPAGRGR